MQYSEAVRILEARMAEYLAGLPESAYRAPYKFSEHADRFMQMFNGDSQELKDWMLQHVRLDQMDSVNRNILTVNVLPAPEAQGAEMHLRTYRLPVSHKAHFASVQDYLSVMLRSAKGVVSLLPEKDRAAKEAEIMQALYHAQGYIQTVLAPLFFQLFQSEGFPSRSHKEQGEQFKVLHQQALDVCRDFRTQALDTLVKNTDNTQKEALKKKLKYAEAMASEEVRPVLINWQRAPALNGEGVCVFKEEVKPQTRVTLSSEAVPEATALRNDLDSSLWKWNAGGFELVDHISRSAALGSELLAEKLAKPQLEGVFSDNLGTLLQQGSLVSTNPEGVSCCFLTVLSPVDSDLKVVQKGAQQGKPMVEAGFVAAQQNGGIYLNHGVNMGRHISQNYERQINAAAIKQLFCMVMHRMPQSELSQNIKGAVIKIQQETDPDKMLDLIFEKMKSFAGKPTKYGRFPPQAERHFWLRDLWFKLSRYLEVVERQHGFVARKVKAIFGNPESDQEKSCMAPVLLADLVQALGIPLHVTCKSGKDRTGYFDEALKVYHSLLLEKPTLDIVHNKEDRAAWLARIDVFMQNAVSGDICRRNTSGVLQVTSKNYAGDTDYDIGNKLAKLYKDIREEPEKRNYKITGTAPDTYMNSVGKILHPTRWETASSAELSAYWQAQLAYTQGLLLMQPVSSTPSPTLFTGTGRGTPATAPSPMGSPRRRVDSDETVTSRGRSSSGGSSNW